MNAPASKSIGGEGDALVGRTLDGRFRIISAIARGGMGAVYRAEQLPLGRSVAIKVLSLRHDEDQDPEFRKRFLLEAATAAKLTHPNTVRIFDYGQTGDGLYFIAMELLEGLTLKEAIAKDGAFDAERAVDITKQIARSLREAHRLGIVHRDMKPGNVMLVQRGGDELVKVLDFGLAKDTTPTEGEVEDITQTGVFMGSPKYMSPEQIQGERLDGRSDIYSVGVILYEMLSGRPPFVRDQPMQVLMDHVRELPPTVAAPAGRPELPPGLVQLVMNCLAKKPEDRYADMDRFLLALKECLGGPMSSSGQIAAMMTGEFDAMRSGLLNVSLSGTGSGPNAMNITPSPAMERLGTIPTIDIDEAVPSDTPPPVAAAPPPSRTGLYAVIAVVALLVVGGGLFFLRGGSDASAETNDPTGTTVTGTSAPPSTAPEAPPSTVADTVPVVPPPTSAPEPPPVIRTVLVSLRSTPSGAMVAVGDRTYGPTPTEVELTGDLAAEGSALHFVFTRAGYQETSVDATVSGPSLEASARMARIPRPTGGGGGSTTTTHESGSTGSDVHVDGYRDSPY